jgi:hypothetical protein
MLFWPRLRAATDSDTSLVPACQEKIIFHHAFGLWRLEDSNPLLGPKKVRRVLNLCFQNLELIVLSNKNRKKYV